MSRQTRKAKALRKAIADMPVVDWKRLAASAEIARDRSWVPAIALCLRAPRAVRRPAAARTPTPSRKQHASFRCLCRTPLGTPLIGQRHVVVPVAAPRHAALGTLVAVRALRLVVIIDWCSLRVATAFGHRRRSDVHVHDGVALVLGARAPAKRALRVDSVSRPQSDTPNELESAEFLIQSIDNRAKSRTHPPCPPAPRTALASFVMSPSSGSPAHRCADARCAARARFH